MKFFPSIIILLLVTGCNSSDSKKETDPAAKQLYDSAMQVWMKYNDHQRALSLLDQSTSIDSNFFEAHVNKWGLLMQNKSFARALQSANTVNRLRPGVPEYIGMQGFTLEMLGDSVGSKKLFADATQWGQKILDTMNRSRPEYKRLRINQGVYQVLSGRETEGNALLAQLYSEEKDPLYKQMISQFMNMSRQQIITLFSGASTAEAIGTENR